MGALHVCDTFSSPGAAAAGSQYIRYTFCQITTFIKVFVAFFWLQTLQSKDFSKIHQLKGLKPKNNSHMNFLWMLWFDENSISTVHTHIYIWRSSSKVIFNPLTAGPSSIFHPVSRQGRKIERFLSRWLQLGVFWGGSTTYGFDLFTSLS